MNLLIYVLAPLITRSIETLDNLKVLGIFVDIPKRNERCPRILNLSYISIPFINNIYNLKNLNMKNVRNRKVVTSVKSSEACR